MKMNLIKHILLLIFIQFVVTKAFALEKYTLDPQHTYVQWHIKHFGFTSQTGKWYATGELQLDKDNLSKSKVNATIKVADMVTGIPELDKHLRGKLFFDTAQYPSATFVSNTIEASGKDTAKVKGVLTVRGVSKPVTLDVTLNHSGINPITENQTLGFTATTEIKRSDFGIKTLLPGLGDEVKVNIEAEAYQVKKQE